LGALGLAAALALGLAGCYEDQGSNGYARLDGPITVNANGVAVVQARVGVGGLTFAVSREGVWTQVPTPANESSGMASPVGIADDGTVLAITGGYVPFLWDAAQGARTLESVAGVALANPVDMAGDGTIVGRPFGSTTGWLWSPSDGTVVDLVAPPGDTVVSEVTAINDVGQVVGTSLSPTGDTHLVAWEAPGYAPVTIGVPDEVDFAGITDINDAGQLVGRGSTEEGGVVTSYALRWSLDSTDAFVIEGNNVQFNAIDDDGTIVGALDGRPAIWDATTLEPYDPGSPYPTGWGTIVDIDGVHLVGTAPTDLSAAGRLVRYFRP
jgi:uncharacterized membrane protein